MTFNFRGFPQRWYCVVHTKLSDLVLPDCGRQPWHIASNLQCKIDDWVGEPKGIFVVAASVFQPMLSSPSLSTILASPLGPPLPLEAASLSTKLALSDSDALDPSMS